MTPYYADETVTLYHGDCLDLLPHIAGVDLALTSPPYNLGASPGAGGFGHYRDGQSKGGGKVVKWNGVGATGILYGAHADDLPYPKYKAWQQEVLRRTWDTLSDRGAIFYNHKPRVQADTLWTPMDLNPGLPLRQIVIWARAGGTAFSPTAYVPTHEWICVFAKAAWRLKDRSSSGVGDVWYIPQETNPDHPAPFPHKLATRAVHTTAPSLVLDPFAGSGTTLLAAKNAGVRSIGIEIDERHCETAAKRLTQDVLDFGGDAA